MRIALVFLAAALVLGGAGCVKEPQDVLEVSYVCAPPDDATKCAPTGGKCDRYLSGWADDYLLYSDGTTNGMYFYMQIKNQRPNNEDLTIGRVNTADAQILSYELSYEAPGVSLPGFTVSAIQETIPAGGSATPFVTLITAEASQAMQAALPTTGWTPVDVFVVFKGRYQDGSSFETGKYKVQTHVYNQAAPGMGCPNKTDVITAVCPNSGQTSTWKCETPSGS